MGGMAWLVVGLGNPGAKYAHNRHNVGAMAIQELAERTQTNLRTHKAGANAATVHLVAATGQRTQVVLATPTKYMNLSGGPVKALANFFSVPPKQIIVLHDELDLDFGVVRLKSGGGEGGHNGLRSISASLGTRDYARVRIGIGRPPGRQNPADFVLRDFSRTEKEELPFLLPTSADAVELIITKGLTAAQNEVHAPNG